MGALTRKQFDILALLAEKEEALSQRKLKEETGYSLTTVNRVMQELSEAGLVRDGAVSPEGLEALEPYRAKRAVFIAAGFGARLVPVTLNTPKPLVRVNGVRIIDTALDACLRAGIRDIVIVRGYLAEQFDQLLYKYPMIRFLENPSYNETNNISSAMCARFLLSNAYVFEADLLVRNPAVIRKYHYTSDYLGFPMARSEDWCFTVKNGIIRDLSMGGLDCWQQIGISYWNEADGQKLARHIEEAYKMPGGRERFWESVPLLAFRDEYAVEIRPCEASDVIEIDTFSELKALDTTYDV